MGMEKYSIERGRIVEFNENKLLFNWSFYVQNKCRIKVTVEKLFIDKKMIWCGNDFLGTEINKDYLL